MGITLAKIGEMRHRIKFEKLVRTPDGQGGFTEEWSPLIAGADLDSQSLWAQLIPVSSRERLFGERLEYQRSHKVVVRYRNDVTNEMRFIFENRIFQIKGSVSPDERKAYLFIDAEENQGT